MTSSISPVPAAFALLASFSALPGCAARAQTLDMDAATPAVPTPEAVKPVAVVVMPTPLPLPGQLKPVAVSPRKAEASDPTARVVAANTAARIQPAREGFLNAIQQYPWTDGALYQLYAAPGQVTDIMLQEGEHLAGTGPVAAGDTVRWIIGDTISGSGIAARVHILIKPTRSGLATNLVINTDRRTYHLELRSTPTTYMASVSWTYPQDQLVALRGRQAAAARQSPVAAGIDVGALDFDYAIDGDKPAWRPLRAFDDGRQIYIEFPESVAQGEMPPLFVIGADGQGELVNYRVRDRYMIVDRLFAAAELRMGTKKSQARVRIVRNVARRGKVSR